ncbi:hypothetical protein IMZ31_16835 [Pontibacillus sp. ALD_SL1]|uniref:zinc ribbon domain-containing protein n=1 Tax=Pontibacillus sp. ALD_SL1 TaxID=2777185 RepID=UPI001A960584|nr:zinc ribbon domain-containing protein [Pontibacillus sp. ALD_SL1]QSS99708.1 hypothetical protein IMZ31_16835 [Pontibacillus sp. ALD_SL1]
MEKQNYYLLLELPYDPPTHDYDVIKKAIQKKRSSWTKKLSNAKYKAQAQENLKLFKEMEVDLKDYNFRQDEARAAKEFKEKQRVQEEKARKEKLDRAILILSTKGFILESEVEQIQKDLKFSEDDILSNVVNVPIKKDQENSKRKNQSASARPSLTKEKMKLIAELLTDLVEEPKIGQTKSLYDLLELSDATGEKELYDKANAEYKTIMSMGKISPQLDMKRNALSHALTVFKDQETRLKYDESLRISRFERIHEYIKIAGSSGEIEKSTFEELKVQAMNEGLTSADAELRLKEFCEEEQISIQSKQPKQKPTLEVEQCGYCGLVNKAKGSTCTGCGQTLQVHCNKCQTVSSSSSQHCSNCGFSFLSMYYQEKYLKDAEWSILKKDYANAQEMVGKASFYWKGHERIQPISNEISHNLGMIEKQENKVKVAIDDGNFFTAERELNVLKKLSPMHDDLTNFERTIQRQLNSAEAYLQKAKAADKDKDKISFLFAALDECADFTAAHTELSKFPPEPPSQIRSGLTNDAIKLEWISPYTKDTVTFEVYRQEGSSPAEKVTSTTNNVFHDKKAEAGKGYRYYLHTLRGNKVSDKSSIVGPLTKTSEVDQLRAVMTDEGIQLSWKSPGRTRIEVWRKEGGLPKERGDGTKLSAVKQNGVLDKNVELEKEYGYVVFVQYADDQGMPFFSNGSTLKTIYSTDTVHPISVTEEKEQFYFNWTQSSEETGEVALLYSEIPFDTYQEKECWPYASLEREANGQVIRNLSSVTAMKERDFSGILYILPVRVIGDYALVGESVELKSIQPVSQLTGKRVQGELILKWQWPEESQKVTIRYSPIGFQDPNAEERECSKFSYENFGGYKLDSFSEGEDVFVTIYVTEEINGEKIFSKPKTFLFTEREPMEIRYSLSVQRKMLFKKEAQLKIKVPEFGIPNLKLVKQKGRTPNRVTDGEAIQLIESTQEHDGEYIIENLTEYIEDDCYAKLFFESKEDAQNFRIVSEPGTTHQLS